jgi:two-component system LytT family response regulator
MRVLIIEDEPATAKRLENMLVSFVPDVTIEDTIDTVEESIKYFRAKPSPDLVFMDIHLADGNSFEIFEHVELSCPIIFTTAYDQYAIKAFKVNSIDYLLKPIKKDELEASLKKFKETTSPSNLVDIKAMMEIFREEKSPELKRLVIKVGQKIIVVKIEEVAYFFIEHKIVYAALHNGKKYPVDFTLDQLEEDLNKVHFFRINRSFIISLDAIKSMTAYSKSRIKIELKPPVKEDVVSSTDRSTDFKKWLKGK